MPPRAHYTILLIATVILGATVRFAAALHLPHVINKYGGSALWAASIFWLASTLVPRASILTRATVSLSLAFAIEFFKLIRTPALDAFRLTLPGKLFLGRFFSPRDLLAYTAGIALAAALDRSLLSKRRNPVR